MKSSESAYHDPGRIAPGAVSSLLPRQNVDAFRRLVRGASREHLLNNVDIYLQQLDTAIMAGDRHAQAWARKQWNIVWDELDRRDGIPGEVAS
jgi:hypothetical protein